MPHRCCLAPSAAGGLPGAWAQLERIRFLGISYNSLAGTLPEATSMPPNLSTLLLGERAVARCIRAWHPA